MTRTEEDLVTSLENRVRALTATVQAQYQQIEYLKMAVELLSMPRITNDDIQGVRDGLLVLTLGEETRH